MLDIGQHQSINIYSLTVPVSITQLFIEDNLLHCIKFDDHPHDPRCINRSDLRMDIGRTNRHITYMVIHSSILQ